MSSLYTDMYKLHMSQYLYLCATHHNLLVQDRLTHCDCLPFSDHLMLFGALKRLVEWHNTHVHFLVTDGGQTGTASYQVQEWLDLLRGSQLPPSGMEEMQRSCLWRGSLVITGTQVFELTTPSVILKKTCVF